MIKLNILKLIEEAGLVGRGGASFPVARKWLAVKSALKKRKTGYIIVNGTEGEPGVKKDGYIMDNYTDDFIRGVYLAYIYLGAEKIKHIYFVLNGEYYKKFGTKIKNILLTKKYTDFNRKIKFIIKPEKLSYICGEESTILNLIEGEKLEPRLRPPFPVDHGLFAAPTLINNVETFYNVNLVYRGRFDGKRFYTINGVARHRGVFSLPAELNIEDVLRKTNNYPDFDFFVQVGGEVSGEVLRPDQLNRPVEGAGSIMIYNHKKTDKQKLLKYWLNFYQEQSCGNCTICREGTYRLWQLINQKNYDKKLFWEIISALEETSFCALGRSLPVPIKSFYLNILKS